MYAKNIDWNLLINFHLLRKAVLKTGMFVKMGLHSLYFINHIKNHLHTYFYYISEKKILTLSYKPNCLYLHSIKLWENKIKIP